MDGDRATVGRGRTGVLAVSGPGGDACQWLDLAGALADRGLRVVLTAAGTGDAHGTDIVAGHPRLSGRMARFLRRSG